MAKAKWSYRKLIAEMRKHGWRSMGQGVYEHKVTGREVQLMAFNLAEKRELWHRYADKQQVPSI